MKFSFKNSPEWFTNYVTETFLDEFHDRAKDDINAMDHNDRHKLLETAVEFFTQKGFTVYCYNKELWFDLDEDQETTMLVLQWS